MILDICMPYWGDPADLKTAVASVLAQTDPHWRLTVIDDCYPGSEATDYFAGVDDPRVVYLRNEENVGIVENFRRAASAAQGSHAVIMGCDDFLMPDFVSRMRGVATAYPEADVVQLGVTVVGADGRPRRTLADSAKAILTPRRATTLRGEHMAASLLRGDWLYWPSLMIRVERLRTIAFRDEYSVILDLAFLIEVAFAGGALHFEPGASFVYRRHSASLSQTTILDGVRFADERHYYRQVARLAGERGWLRARRVAIWRPMSRLHALAVLPAVIRRGTSQSRRSALALAFAA